MPQVSVVVNVLNGASTIRSAITSALSQSITDLEVIVWDNGSDDETENFVSSFDDRRLRYFRTDQTVPLYNARNLAVARCKGEFVAFLDADDWWRIDKIERQLELFQPGVDAVYSNYFVFNEVNGTVKPYSRRMLPSGRVFSELLERYRVGLLTLVVRREVFQREHFNPDLEIIGDFDFVMRLARNSEFACDQEPLAWSRISGSNESERKKTTHLQELTRWCENGEQIGTLRGRDLRNMRRMVLAKQAEVEIEAGCYARGMFDLVRVRPAGRQVKVVQRIMISRRSVRRHAKRIDRL